MTAPGLHMSPASDWYACYGRLDPEQRAVSFVFSLPVAFWLLVPQQHSQVVSSAPNQQVTMVSLGFVPRGPEMVAASAVDGFLCYCPMRHLGDMETYWQEIHGRVAPEQPGPHLKSVN